MDVDEATRAGWTTLGQVADWVGFPALGAEPDVREEMVWRKQAGVAAVRQAVVWLGTKLGLIPRRELPPLLNIGGEVG